MGLVTCLRTAKAHTTNWKKKKKLLILQCTRCSSVMVLFVFFRGISTFFFNHIHHKYNVKSRPLIFNSWLQTILLAIHSKFRGLQAPLNLIRLG